MIVKYSRRFVKNFKIRIKPNPKLRKRFNERLKTFAEDPSTLTLRDHKLVGKIKSFRAFSITGDVRVIYSQESGNEVIFIDIGTHNQVYEL